MKPPQISTIGAMQLNTTQPIIIEAGATAVFSYVDVNFKGTAPNRADGGDGDAGDAGAAGANGRPPGQPGPSACSAMTAAPAVAASSVFRYPAPSKTSGR